jgi:Flp pilus assembly pilin Flp
MRPEWPVQCALLAPHPAKELFMKKLLRNAVAGLLRDERGSETLEYALIAGLIVVAAIAIVGTLGTKVLARWQSMDGQ